LENLIKYEVPFLLPLGLSPLSGKLKLEAMEPFCENGAIPMLGRARFFCVMCTKFKRIPFLGAHSFPNLTPAHAEY
jgi:hypothetical protein